MAKRRILSLWFPRLGAERLLRQMRQQTDGDGLALAIVESIGNAERLSSLSPAASAAGLSRGLSLRDACAVCPTLETRRRNPHAEAQFLTVLARWANQFSPWVTRDGDDGLLMDVTGCAHLFGGEPGMTAQIAASAQRLGLSLRLGLADTRGGALGTGPFCRANRQQ
ncbi:Y-family DNA polymerase [Roseobacteraceae bacterium S113]